MSWKPPVQPAFALTVSEAARAALTPMLNADRPEITAQMLLDPQTMAGVRTMLSEMFRPVELGRLDRFGVEVADAVMGGVPVQRLWKTHADPALGDRLLINLHGGAFMLGSGFIGETVPIVGLTGIPAITVDYRLAPEHPYPAAVDDALAVYRAVLEDYAPAKIAVFGTSAGAMLTMQLLARLKIEGLPMPAAAGVFSGGGDMMQVGDCEAYLPPIIGGRTIAEVVGHYCGDMPRDNPLLSPNFGDLSGFPPVMLMSSTRDQLLSQTVLTDLALRKAGVAVDLRVYEGMPHAFWGMIECPETEVALKAQADFLAHHLSA